MEKKGYIHMIFRRTLIATLAGSFVLAGTVAGYSLGGNSDTSTTTTKLCPTGYVYSKKKKRCVKKKAGVVDDRQLKAQGWALARAGRYDDAIGLFSLAADQKDPEVLNGLGYANRKAGRFDIAFNYYKRALTIDPDYVLAREYLGEGLVAIGRPDLAKIQLKEIGNRCGTACVEYVKLAAVIDGKGRQTW